MWIIFIISLMITPALFQKGPPMMAGTIQPYFQGNIGGGIRFLCPIKADPEPIYEWYRDGERVMEYWDRYRFGSRGYSLNIHRLECEDQGTYVCKAINGFGVQEISFQLDLFDEMMREACQSNSDEDDAASKPVLVHRPKKHFLKPAGNYAILKCTAVAEPLPKFHWFKNGVEIAVNKSKTAGVAPKYAIRSTVLSEEDLADVSDMEGLRSTLQISDLRGSDSGNYTCRAKNEHGMDELTQILEVVERQIPQRPEMHPEFPAAETWVEAGETGVLSCKVLSEFPPQIHWLKRILPAQSNPGALLPLLPNEEEVEAVGQPQFIANRTLIIGNTQYQILPPVPVKTTPDGFYTSVLLLSKKTQEIDAGYYVCLALNNAGFNYRQVYFNVTQPHHPNSIDIQSTGSADGWGDRGRADAATTTVVVVVVVCGLAGMITSCFIWRKRKDHLNKDKPPNCKPELVVIHQRPPSNSPAPLIPPAPPVPDYSAFREGLTEGKQPVQHRIYYLSPRPAAAERNQQRTRSSQRHYRSPTSRNVYYADPPYPHYPSAAETRSMLTSSDTSFHSDSIHSDWSPHHLQPVRLPYPSPNNSFDQL